MTTSLTPNHIRYALANLPLLTFEVTDACNLKCKYCGYGEFYNDYDERKDRNFPFGYARQLLDYLANFWNSNRNISSDRNVYIGFYGGEPLLNMTFVKNVVDYVEKIPVHHRHFSFAMTTNAILLDKHMDYLAEKRFNLLISLDGNAFNDSYRVDKAGNPSFDRVVRNVNLLRERHPDYFRLHANFNSVLHNRNSVQDIHDFFKREYDKIPSIGELNNMGIREDKRELFNMTYRNQMESLMQSEHYEEIDKERFISSPTYQSVCTFLHQYCDFVYRDYNELLYGKPEENRWITGTCMPFGKKMFVTVNGKILPCERIGQQFALGTVNENGVALDFGEIADKYNDYFSKLESQCNRCFNRKSCVQCIFNLEDLDNHPVCHGCMNHSDFEKYKAQNMAFIAANPEAYYRLMEEVIVE
ncbi:MAG: radical SAM peptide maturase [Bacteroidales bacterium]|nr:radical SAM peptide maturase [Bacteroidales bacterium]